jgi:hypothetical protein
VSVTLRCRIVVDGFSCVELGVCLSCVLGVVAQPLRRAETLVSFSGSCVAPLRLGGRRGKQSTPRIWLGGTGEPSVVGKWDRREERTQHGAVARDSVFESFATRSRYAVQGLKQKEKCCSAYDLFLDD